MPRSRTVRVSVDRGLREPATPSVVVRLHLLHLRRLHRRRRSSAGETLGPQRRRCRSEARRGTSASRCSRWRRTGHASPATRLAGPARSPRPPRTSRLARPHARPPVPAPRRTPPLFPPPPPPLRPRHHPRRRLVLSSACGRHARGAQRLRAAQLPPPASDETPLPPRIAVSVACVCECASSERASERASKGVSVQSTGNPRTFDVLERTNACTLTVPSAQDECIPSPCSLSLRVVETRNPPTNKTQRSNNPVNLIPSRRPYFTFLLHARAVVSAHANRSRRSRTSTSTTAAPASGGRRDDHVSGRGFDPLP